MRAATTLIALVGAGCTNGEVRVAHPPAAFAGFDAVVEQHTEVVLDGTQSRDPDGDRLLYAWKLEARPLGSLASITAPRSPLASVMPDRLGGYVVSLSVSDDDFTRRDLITLRAVEPAATSTAPLAIALAPRSCNADFDRISDAACGDEEGRIAIEPVMLVYPPELSARLVIEWIVLRLPLGVGESELDLQTPNGELGRLTFAPRRPGEYWIGARLRPIRGGAASPLAVATVALFTGAPRAEDRPLPVIEAPQLAEVDRIVLFDARASYVPTSSTGERPRRTWSLVADPSNGDDELTDVATGCQVDECRRLIPSRTGDYLIALSIGDSVTAVAPVEVR